jgi:hypothetical protein
MIVSQGNPPGNPRGRWDPNAFSLRVIAVRVIVAHFIDTLLDRVIECLSAFVEAGAISGET